MNHTEQRLINIFETVFPDLPLENIRTATQNSVANWDSVAAITLMNLIEEEFEIQLDFNDVADLTSFAKVLEYLKERTAQSAV